jgi:asparagine synthetase B (glutamine-hydrolysing)
MLGPEFKDLQAYDGWWFYKQHWLPELDPFRRAQWSDFKCYLPTVLKKVDRCTMQHSLEARCPLLLPELIEFMLSLPTPIKNPKGEFKYLYREWLRRSNLVPASLLNAPKSGFGISSIVANEFRGSERLWACVNTARRNGWISSAGYVAAQREWTCAWRMALIGAALERGVLRE